MFGWKSNKTITHYLSEGLLNCRVLWVIVWMYIVTKLCDPVVASRGRSYEYL